MCVSGRTLHSRGILNVNCVNMLVVLIEYEKIRRATVCRRSANDVGFIDYTNEQNDDQKLHVAYIVYWKKERKKILCETRTITLFFFLLLDSEIDSLQDEKCTAKNNK